MLCGHRAWFSDLNRYLWGQLDAVVCSRCGKATLRDTGRTRRGWGYPLLYLEEGECIQCGNKEWYYRLNGSG